MGRQPKILIAPVANLLTIDPAFHPEKLEPPGDHDRYSKYWRAKEGLDVATGHISRSRFEFCESMNFKIYEDNMETQIFPLITTLYYSVPSNAKPRTGNDIRPEQSLLSLSLLSCSPFPRQPHSLSADLNRLDGEPRGARGFGIPTDLNVVVRRRKLKAQNSRRFRASELAQVAALQRCRARGLQHHSAASVLFLRLSPERDLVRDLARVDFVDLHALGLRQAHRVGEGVGADLLRECRKSE